jgi:hypothetical protein
MEVFPVPLFHPPFHFERNEGVATDCIFTLVGLMTQHSLVAFRVDLLVLVTEPIEMSAPFFDEK